MRRNPGLECTDVQVMEGRILIPIYASKYLSYAIEEKGRELIEFHRGQHSDNTTPVR